MEIELTENESVIKNCYRYSDEYLRYIVSEIVIKRNDRDLKITRSIRSYLCEAIAHKRMYKLGLFRSKTKDCNLEENINKVIEIMYYIIGINLH